MRTLNLGNHRRARVWIGALPDAAYPSQGLVSSVFAAHRTPVDKERTAAVELLVPLGPRSMYGLLGGRLRYGASDCLRVEVSIAAPYDRLLTDNIAMPPEEVRVGLPEEYAEPVLEGVRLALHHPQRTIPGTLSIDHAAYAAVSSPAVVYKHIAHVLVRALTMENSQPSDEEVAALFPITYD